MARRPKIRTEPSLKPAASDVTPPPVIALGPPKEAPPPGAPPTPPPPSPPPPSPSPEPSTPDEAPLDPSVRRRIETNLKVTFFLTLSVGLLAASLENWFIPAAAVLVYATVGWMITRKESNIERFADSLYYMGFLFTIWGLFFAFRPWSGDVENLSSKTIITQFGIKLSTTVIALTARILILQARGTLAEESDGVHDTLAAAASRMTREVRESAGSFKQMRDDLLKQAGSGITDIQAEAMRSLQASSNELLRRMNAMLDEVKTSTDSLLARLNAIDVPADIIAAKLDQAAQTIAAEMDQLRQSLHQSALGVSQEVQEALARVVQAGGQVDAAVQGLAAFERLATESQNALRSIEASNAGYQETLQRNTRLLEEFATVIAQMRDASRHDIARLRDDIEKAAKTIAARGESMGDDAKRFSETLTDSIRVLRREIERQ